MGGREDPLSAMDRGGCDCVCVGKCGCGCGGLAGGFSLLLAEPGLNVIDCCATQFVVDVVLESWEYPRVIMLSGG